VAIRRGALLAASHTIHYEEAVMQLYHLSDDESTVLSDAERAPLRATRSRRHPSERAWISTREPASLEHDPHDVARCVREGLLAVTTDHTLAITDHGRDALMRYRFDCRPVELVA
jgi:hypothetical protein